MQTIWAKQALLPQGWARDVRLTVATDGRVEDVCSDTVPDGHRVGVLLPAPVNVHSHAFQRAMAGLTERRGPDMQDSFWTWRRLMFRFLDRLNPDQIQAVTALAQLEMLEAGYATSVEFHYLHHQSDGRPYDNIAEMSERVAAAAATTGIGFCLLPVHYQFGGCDGRALTGGQIRFGNDLERFQSLHEAAKTALNALPADTGHGVAPHSLRAVSAADLRRYGDLFPEGPIHMHLAEQISEVEEVLANWGARPVDWALDNLAPDARWCLVHCTQMTEAETIRLAKTGAVAGLCPITESNLGDGIFDGVRWLEAGGALAVGTDSNIRISLSEELRMLEYSQRLRDHGRAVLVHPGQSTDQSTGRSLFELILKGGARASGRDTGQLAAGKWADMLSLDDSAIHMFGKDGDIILDSWIFAADDRLVRDVWSAGRHMVQNGSHIRRDEIIEDYRAAMTGLKDVL